MQTIRMLARVGPWTLMQIELVGDGESKAACDRCRTAIAEIYCLELDPAAADRVGLSCTWRVGNECGPHLFRESQLVWSGADPQTLISLGKSKIRLFSRIQQVLRAASEHGEELTIGDKLLAAREDILNGRAVNAGHLNGIVTGAGKRFGLWK